MPHPTMQIVASTDAVGPARAVHRVAPGVDSAGHRAYRQRLAALRSRAPDSLRVRVVRELRAVARQTAPR